MMKAMVMLMVIVMAVGITGCGSKSETENVTYSGNIVILNGKHANAVNFNISDLRSEIKNTCRHAYGTTFTLIEVDGNPYLVQDRLTIKKQKSGLFGTSDSQLEKIAETQTEHIMQLLADATPKTQELDTLRGIQMAAQQLEGAEGKKTLIIMDTGLSTTGLVNFQEILLESDCSEKIVESLEAENAIPDLQGVDVIWYGLGQTVAPQRKLYQKNHKNLEAGWRAVLEAGGANNITFHNELIKESEESSKEDTPFISTIPINKPASILAEEVKLSDPEEKESVYEMGEDELSFKAGSAQLRISEKQALKVLTPFIQYLKENPNESILVLGTTASADTKEKLLELSLERVKTVKRIMIEQGVKGKQIQTAGLGFHNPYTIKDTDEKGNFVESLGSQNRKVIITNINSKTAKRILKNCSKETVR